MTPAPNPAGETVVGLWIASLGILWLSLLVSVVVDSLVAGAIIGIGLGLTLTVVASFFIARAQGRKQAEAEAQLERLEKLAAAIHGNAGSETPGVTTGAAWGSPGQ